MSHERSGAKTLLWSIIMASPGPLTVGLALIGGHTATQIADFVRRSAELIAIIMAFAVYTAVNRDDTCDEERKQRLERRSDIFIGFMMCVAGAVMAIISVVFRGEDKGNVIPGLCIAVLGMVSNSTFWIKYSRLNKTESSPIFAVQLRLYRAKSLVDTSVAVALTAILISPIGAFADWVDAIGSMTVAVYMMWCGLRTVLEEFRRPNEKARAVAEEQK